MNPNSVLFCGDPHGEFDQIIIAVHRHKPAAIVLLGDYNLELPLERHLAPIVGMTGIYWIHGNHDLDSVLEYENLFCSALSHNNLNRKAIDVQGIRIAGLGGIFLGKIWYPPAPPLYENRRQFLRCHAKRNEEKGLSIAEIHGSFEPESGEA